MNELKVNLGRDRWCTLCNVRHDGECDPEYNRGYRACEHYAVKELEAQDRFYTERIFLVGFIAFIVGIAIGVWL